MVKEEWQIGRTLGPGKAVLDPRVAPVWVVCLRTAYIGTTRSNTMATSPEVDVVPKTTHDHTYNSFSCASSRIP